ncbi:MAG: META domain-containing protein [Hyphomonadaceae bacterium]
MFAKIASATALLALAACATPAEPLPTEAPRGVWELENIAGAANANDAPQRPTAEFEGARISGFAGCNRYFAEREADPNVARYFRGVGATRMYCEGPGMALETAFLERLGNTMNVRVIDGKLIFYGDSEVELMRFRPAASGQARQ